MESIASLVTEVGSFGVLLALAAFIIYNHFKTDTKKDNTLNELKATLESNTAEIKGSIKGLDNRISNLERNVTNDMSLINKRIDEIECDNKALTSEKHPHTKQFADRLKLGPQLHKSLNNFRSRINADHIFIGSFHNGNQSLTGIPYYKFDIIAERFRIRFHV